MHRRMFMMSWAALLVAAYVSAAPSVVGPDEQTLDDAVVVEGARGYWVSDGPNLPLQLTPEAGDLIRVPRLSTSRLLILDAITARPISGGQLRWDDAGIPEHLAEVRWAARAGRLDLSCRGKESVTILVDGYRPITTTLDVDGRRRTLLLEPHGDLELLIRPAAAGTLRLAAGHEITVIAPFFAAAGRYPIAADGSVTVCDLDADAEYKGVVVVPGMAPFVGSITGLPQRLELRLDPGRTINGTVLDSDGQPISGALVKTEGRIESLGNLRYEQEGKTNGDGRFVVSGLLPGKILVKACATGRACEEATIELENDGNVEPLRFELGFGHDLRLEVQDEFGRAVAEATVVDTRVYRKFRTDDKGVLVFPGVRPDQTLELKVFGAGLTPWEGTIATDSPVATLRIPQGGILEWPILTNHEVSADEVVASWTRHNRQGREIANGTVTWDAESRLIRADGLEPGPHRLKVRLPGAATMLSEVVELGPGEQIQLPPAVPERGLAISGRVLDGGSFAPVAGARVSCEPGSPHQFRKPGELRRLPTALTDADGVFLLEGLDPGLCRAVVQAAGFASWRRDGVEPDEIGADVGDIELDQGMTVVGKVRDRAGRALTAVAVEISEDATYAYFPEATIRTDHDGHFRAETLPVGRWTLTARHGGQTARTTVEGRADETVSAELRIGGVRLEGEVWIGDRPAEGGHLVLSTGGARADGIVVMVQTDADQRNFFGVGRPPVTITVGADGRFAAVGIDAGVYTASYTPPGAGGSPVSRELVVPQTETHRCLVQYADAAVDGFVIDVESLPVAGASVSIRAEDGQTLARGFSDGSGAFAFVGLDPGSVRLVAAHGEFSDSEAIEVELRSADRVGPVTLELGPPDGAELSLRVSASGGSLAGAPVYLVGAETLTAFTDGQGVTSFTGVDRGRYRPCAAAYGGAVGCGSEIDLSDGDRREMVLDLGRGGTIDVLLGPQERVPSLRVFTTDDIDLTSLLMMVNPPLPGPDGLRLGPLRGDDYRIVVSTASGPREGTIGTVENETVELDLR